LAMMAAEFGSDMATQRPENSITYECTRT